MAEDINKKKISELFLKLDEAREILNDFRSNRPRMEAREILNDFRSNRPRMETSCMLSTYKYKIELPYFMAIKVCDVIETGLKEQVEKVKKELSGRDG